MPVTRRAAAIAAAAAAESVPQRKKKRTAIAAAAKLTAIAKDRMDGSVTSSESSERQAQFQELLSERETQAEVARVRRTRIEALAAASFERACATHSPSQLGLAHDHDEAGSEQSDIQLSHVLTRPEVKRTGYGDIRSLERLDATPLHEIVYEGQFLRDRNAAMLAACEYAEKQHKKFKSNGTSRILLRLKCKYSGCPFDMCFRRYQTAAILKRQRQERAERAFVEEITACAESHSVLAKFLIEQGRAVTCVPIPGTGSAEAIASSTGDSPSGARDIGTTPELPARLEGAEHVWQCTNIVPHSCERDEPKTSYTYDMMSVILGHVQPLAMKLSTEVAKTRLDTFVRRLYSRKQLAKAIAKSRSDFAGHRV